MSVIRSLFVLLLIALAIPVAATLMQVNQTVTAQAQQAAQLQRQQTYTVRVGDVQSTISALGGVEAAETVDVPFLASGQVTKVPVQTGDYIYKGQALVQLDSTAEQIAYDQAKLDLEKANLAMQKLLAPPDPNDVKIAQANLNSARASYTSAANSTTPEDLAAAQLKYDKAQQALYDAHRQRQVTGNIDDNQITQLDAQIGALSFSAELARLSLESLKRGNPGQLDTAGARIAEAQANLNQLMAGPKQSDIDTAQTALDRAEAGLRDAEIALNRTTLISPVDGLVTAVNVKVGTSAKSGAAAVQLTNSTSLRALAAVDETDEPAISEGMKAYIQLDALPDEKIPAQVTQIDFVGTNSNNVVSYNTTLTLQTSDPRVRVGMTGEAFFIKDEHDNVLVVPNTYLHVDPQTGNTSVSLFQRGATTPVQVTVGIKGQDQTEIVSGLRAGQVIASTG